MSPSGKIFVLQEGRTLRPLEEQPFENEDLFQGLLESYPDLLAGDQINRVDPRRWLLVAREFGIPGSEGTGGRWAVDHLFLDHEGVPTLVEVKRSTDTRIRREVVGQMLDYAANAVVYWLVEGIRAAVESGCQSRGEHPTVRIAELLGAPPDQENVDTFWSRVGANLSEGRIRMIFVADFIPDELRRIIEFLNVQMSPAEVLGVEIRHFAGEGIRTLVPLVFGATSAAEQKKSQGGVLPRWDEPKFFTELAKRGNAVESEVAKRVLRWADEHGMRIWWGRGEKLGSFAPTPMHNGRSVFLFDVWITGKLYFHFDYLRRHAVYASSEVRRELAARFGAIVGIDLPPNAFDRSPSFFLGNLALQATFDMFIALVEEVFARLTETR